MGFQINVIPEWSTFISQLLSTLVLFLVIRHFLFKPINARINARNEKLQEDLLEARRSADEAKRLEELYEQKMDEAKNEAMEVIISAKQKEDKIKQEILEDTRNEAEKMFLKAKNNIEAEKAKALMDLKHGIVEIAMLTAATAIDKELDENVHQELITKFIQEVGDIEWTS